TQPRPQLGPLDRLLTLVAWRHSVLQALPYRLSRKTKLPGYRSLTPALDTNRTPYTPVYLHLEHPSGVPSRPRCSSERGPGGARQGTLEGQAWRAWERTGIALHQGEPHRQGLRLHGAGWQAKGVFLSRSSHRGWPPRDHHRYLCDAGHGA